MDITAEFLRRNKCEMFSERVTTDAALAYGQAMFPRDMHAALATFCMVYHNTLLESLAKIAEGSAQAEEN